MCGRLKYASPAFNARTIPIARPVDRLKNCGPGVEGSREPLHVGEDGLAARDDDEQAIAIVVLNIADDNIASHITHAYDGRPLHQIIVAV